MIKVISNPIYKKDEKNKKWKFRAILNVDGQLKDIKRRGFESKKDAKTAYDELILSYEGYLPLEENEDSVSILEKEPSLKIIDKKNENLGWGVSIEELYEKYAAFAETQIKSGSIRSATDALQKHVLPYFENRDVATITAEEIKNWKLEIADKKYSFRYKSKIYSAFSGMISYGVKYMKFPYNIVKQVGNFKNNDPKKEMLFWTEEEFLRFIKVVDDNFYKLVFTTLYLTGMRKGESLALTWGDIDFQRKEINISKSLNRKRAKKGGGVILTNHPENPSSFGWHVSKNRSYEITTPKNKASYRQILMPDNLFEMINEYYMFEKQCYGFSNNAFVFGGQLPISDQTLRRRFNSFAEKAGVKRIRVHDLRHSHASLLINKGQNILIVSKRLGHSNIMQTLNTYSHLMPNMQLEIVGALNFDIK